MTTLDYLEQIDETLSHWESYFHGQEGKDVTVARANLSKVKELLNMPVVSGSYYWVKCFKDSEYEPAKAKQRYGEGEMCFYFTNGSVKECRYVADYKELNYCLTSE